MQPIVHKHVTYRDITLDGNSMGFLGDIYGDLHIHTDSTEPRKKPFHTIPFAPDPDFVDRPDILAWIRDQFTWPGARAALVGLGGVGKSQIAIQYAYSVHSPDEKERASRKFVFWVHASSRARFEQAYRNLADRLALPGRDNPKIDCLKLVSDWLCDEENGKWTMILDNVDDPELFYPRETSEQAIALANYLPQSLNGSILITSRNKKAAARLAGGYPKIKEIAPMNEEQALKLLSNKMQDKVAEDEGTALLQVLGYIPLAIAQAAAYINQLTRMTPSKYLIEFDKNNKKRQLLDWDEGDIRRDSTASNSVVITWQMSFDHIRHSRRSAADLLSLMSFFNPQGIPESALKQYYRDIAQSQHHESGSSHVYDELEVNTIFGNDLSVLQNYSLVKIVKDTDSCEMHSLVQFCTQIWLSSISESGDVNDWKQKFIKLMAHEFPTADFENWEKCQKLLPHVESLYSTESVFENDESLMEWAQILLNSASFMWQKGLYSTAYKAATRVLATRERLSNLDIELALKTISLLALVLSYQGKYDEAEKLHREAIEEYTQELGSENAGTLESVSHLALVLEYQGKFQESEKRNQQALEGRERVLGVHHASTLTSVSNLAVVYGRQGNYDKAEEFSWRALQGKENQLGPEHPDTLISVNNLAWVLLHQGKLNEAEQLSRRALTGKEKELGNHPETLKSMSLLALVLEKQSKYSEAEKLYRKVLEEREKELGQLHPDTLVSVHSLGWVLGCQGNYKAAVDLSRRALEGREKELGTQHPDTLLSVGSLSFLLWRLGDYEEAEVLGRRAMEVYEKEFGAQHDYTIKSMSHLASIMADQRRYIEAETLLRRVIEYHDEEQTGSEDPETWKDLSTLAFLLGNQAFVLGHHEKYEEAEKLSRRVLEQRGKQLGLQHPDTLLEICNLAFLLGNQNKYTEAEELSRRALNGREKVLGKYHRDTLTSLNNLAFLLRIQGKYVEAERLSWQAVERREKELGSEHPDTLTSVNNLALVLGTQGKLDMAETLNRRAMEGRDKKLGRNHVDTLTSVHCLACLLHLQKRYREATDLYQWACSGFESQVGSRHSSTVACKMHFSAMQEEETNMSQQGEETKPSKESSLFARLKGKVRRKGA